MSSRALIHSLLSALAHIRLQERSYMGYDFIGSRSERLAAERRVDRLREFGFIVLVVLLWAAAVMFFFYSPSDGA